MRVNQDDTTFVGHHLRCDRLLSLTILGEKKPVTPEVMTYIRAYFAIFIVFLYLLNNSRYGHEVGRENIYFSPVSTFPPHLVPLLIEMIRLGQQKTDIQNECPLPLSKT